MLIFIHKYNTMPRLSLYKPEKGPDFRFLDRVINEQFQVGGTDIYIHKYIGTTTPAEGESTPTTPNNSTLPIPELGIQDLLFMENRDRKYEPDVYILRGIYQMQDLDFNLSQFGLFLTNDNIMVHFHLRSAVDALQRKIMPGDVFELPHLKDEYALDDSIVALKRFYVVTDVTRPTNGFSQTWYPHLLRAKCQPLVDTQEFAEILNKDSGAGDGSTLRDLLSTYQKSIDINNQIIEQANQDAPLSGYDKNQYYIVPTRQDGLVDVAAASSGDTIDADNDGQPDASFVLNTPKTTYYVGVTSGNGNPPNGATFGSGIQFPSNPTNGQFYLRTDYLPNALYRYDGKRWMLYEQGVRMTMNQFGNQDVAVGTHFEGYAVRQTQKTSFVNNVNTSTIAGKVIEERQALSKVLKPKADN
jgi:hypothetical protein